MMRTFSLRTLLLFISGLGVILLWCSPAPYTYIHTRGQNDLAVVGDGWLVGVDSQTSRRSFFKACTLSKTENGELTGKVGGAELELEPRMTFDEPVEALKCQPDGRIMIVNSNSDPVSIGQLELAILHSHSDSFFLSEDDLLTPPHTDVPNSSTGFIQSGWLLQQESLFDRLTKISLGEIAILIVACATFVRLFRLTAESRSNE